MTHRHNNTPRPPQTNADVMAQFADWLRDNPTDWPSFIRGDEYDADGTDQRIADMQVSDLEARHYERVLGIAS